MSLYSLDLNMETILVEDAPVLTPALPTFSAIYNSVAGEITVIFEKGTAVADTTDEAVSHKVGLVSEGAFIGTPETVLVVAEQSTYTKVLTVTPGSTVTVGVQAVDADAESTIVQRTAYTKPTAPVLTVVESTKVGTAEVTGTLDVDGKNTDVNQVAIYARIQGELEYPAEATGTATVTEGEFTTELTGLVGNTTYEIVARSVHSDPVATEAPAP